MFGPNPSVFVSCVSDDFEAPAAPFPGLRGRLRGCLARAECDARVQEDFAQTDALTVLKLANFIRKCAAVIHLVGGRAGSVAAPKAVAEFVAATPGFLDTFPALRAALGDFSGLTYTQWEAVLALHFGVRLRMYATPAGRAGQAEHLRRLRLENRHASDFADEADLYRQLVGDLREIVPALGAAVPRIAPSRILRHAPDRLFGRESWLDELDAAWADDAVNVLALVAWGGVGKTALVAHWVASRFHTKKWPGVERYFDWSFYSQGTGDSRQSSADLFTHAALTFFDDPDPLKGGAWERGERLAELVRQHRTLLVLDGVEPLQYPPTDAQAGRFKDPGLQALVQGLAADNRGLCVVTTREQLANVESQPAVRERKLDALLRDAAVALLRHLQLVGSEEEMAAACDAAGGHALTLRILGRLIARAYGRDVRKWREVKFEEADRLAQGRSAMRVMRKYEEWLRSASAAEQLELAVLRLTGLFDRPMSPDCFRALCAAPPIPGLTEQLVGARSSELEAALDTLVRNDLLTHGGDEPGGGVVLHAARPIDAHPLIREYFSQQLKKDQPAAFREGHSRLFDHLCKTTKPHQPETLEELQPLYQAVVHGCHAGRYQEACDKVYHDRILRGTGSRGFYSRKQLGANGANLAAVAAFFDEPWSRVTLTLSADDQAWLLSQAAYSLRALGRLTEAVSPNRAGYEMRVEQRAWEQAATSAINLSLLEVTLGQLPKATDDAYGVVEFADRIDSSFLQMTGHALAADALHQAGRRTEAGDLFREAERVQVERQPMYNLLYSLTGFLYCDWFLAPIERAPWRAVLGRILPSAELGEYVTACDVVDRRATSTLRWVTNARTALHDIGLDHLTLARVGLYRALLAGPPEQPMLDLPHVAAALSTLRSANDFTYLPRGLLTAALYHHVRGEPAAARRLLDECQGIAERGPMPLFLADVHLHRARLFRDTAELKKAAKLIRDLGYGRRFDELADAEAALGPAS